MPARFNPGDYLEVKDRLPLFWTAHPEGRIDTEIVMISDDWARIIIRASVYRHADDAHPAAVGLAEETQTPNGGGANRFSHIENCETSAIGRALANYRFQGSAKRPSREEMAKGPRREDAAPAPRALAPVAPSTAMTPDAVWFRAQFEAGTIAPRDANEYAVATAGVRLRELTAEQLAAARAHFATRLAPEAAQPAA